MTCTTCHAEVPAGTRWCPMCRSNAHVGGGKLASPARRLAAHMLDIGIPVISFLFMFGMAGATQSSGLGWVLFLGYAIWAITLFSRGTTPGKKLMGIRVVKETGEPAGFGTMLIREWIGKAISSLIFALGFLWILIDKERQGWHDKLVSTYVVQ